MLRFLKSFFGKHTTQEPQAPYKVELPAPATVSVDVAPIIAQVVPSKPEPGRCGCGRSTTGFCVGLHKLTAEEWAAHPDNKSKPTAPKQPAVKKPVATKQPAVKKPVATKQPAVKKPVAKKAPAKKKSV